MTENDGARRWVFARGSAGVDEIQAVIDEVLAGSMINRRRPPVPRQGGPGHGDQQMLDLTELEPRMVDLGSSLRVSTGPQENSAEIVIEIGKGLAVEFAWELWVTQIWPRLSGTADDAIGPRRDGRHTRRP
ncbi:hypothetical protein [Kineosporia sp. NBRC 101731]|uniref:hypothetical protein n=1 Tax=Kineosporia sp. NBRC 101731 TaxID=3032199 RepID=UPI0024A3D2BD|nr:hypothetical protein [Kineosporia sp. NBRC 101731]GLY30004.1 hypothetical protein Kisp02_33690 [Kineosporia sp. NBRC 101731]